MYMCYFSLSKNILADFIPNPFHRINNPELVCYSPFLVRNNPLWFIRQYRRFLTRSQPSDVASTQEREMMMIMMMISKFPYFLFPPLFPS